ncbi:M12 family metallo-peptidase [Ferruginibacter sp.]|nr:PKD domain-containing protein [Ferruginibacter sp.]
MKLICCFLIFSCCFHLVCTAQEEKIIPGLIKQSFAADTNDAIKLFQSINENEKLLKAEKQELSGAVKNFSLFKLSNNYNVLQKQIAATDKVSISFPIAKNKSVDLKLIHNQITTADFFVKTSDGKLIKNPAGINNHFLGVAAGNNNSIAAVSFNRHGVTGIVSDASGNTVIEPAGKNGLQILYNDNDIITKQKLNCVIDEDADLKNEFKNSGLSIIQSPQSCKTVKMYIECTYAMYLSHNSNIDSVINFVFTLFNASSAIFKNDGINIQLSELFIWNQPDIYAGITNTPALAQALQNKLAMEYQQGNSVNADIAHLITNLNFSGGAATGIGIINNCGKVNGVLTSAASSSIRPFPALPAFSFAVFTFAHETGHMLGSPHTQSCSWPGGAIDDCATPEGICLPGPPPVTGGTIMSYCYNSPYGVNFLNGFGPLPSALIRDQIEGIPCISSCEDTVCSNVQLKGVEATISTSTIKLKWIKEAPKYRIGLKPNTTQQWQHYEVVNADSFILAKTACEALYEFSITPFCASLNKYGISYFSTLGDAKAIQLKIKIAFFNGSSISLCAGDSVLLSASPDSNYVYRWYVNGVLQTQFTSDSIFAKKAGKYNAITTVNGCDYYSDTFTIFRVAQNPRITVNASGLNANFIRSSSCTKNVLWDFGDGLQSNLDQVTHVYASKGIYIITLTVWDADGNMEQVQKPLHLFDEYIDSLNGATQFGQSGAVNYTDFACRSVAFFNADTLFKNGSATVVANPFLRYLSGIGNTLFSTPKTGTIEFKLYPQRGLIKARGNYTDVLQSDTGYVLNVSFSVNNERNTFFLNFSKWGGLQVAVDSVVLGNIANGVAGPLRLNEWNNIGISYGDKGIHVMLNGKLFASDPHIIDSAHAALLGRFHFGTHTGRIVGYGAAFYLKSFEGALDLVRFSHQQKDFTFSSAIAWQGKDTVVVNKQICFGSSYDGHNKTETYFKKNITAGGCDSVTTVNLKVNDDIIVSDSIVHPVDATPGKIIVKNVSGGAGKYKFTWSTGDTTKNLNNVSEGNYTLKVKDSIGCEKNFNYNLYQLNSNHDYIVLLPNPAIENKKITVRIGTVKSKKYDCIIYDITGRKHWEQTIQTNIGVIDVTLNKQLHKGVYVLHLINNKEKRSIKFIVN